MRKWHRWLSVAFGVFLLWISVTGLLSQIVPLTLGGGGDKQRAAALAAPAGFKCPETMVCRPKRKGAELVGTLHHLHSGESFGPIGRAIGILSGLALLFFSVSGLWMYIQLWRSRSARGLKPGWFWK